MMSEKTNTLPLPLLAPLRPPLRFLPLVLLILFPILPILVALVFPATATALATALARNTQKLEQITMTTLLRTTYLVFRKSPSK